MAMDTSAHDEHVTGPAFQMFDFRGGDYRGGTAPPTFKYPDNSLR